MNSAPLSNTDPAADLVRYRTMVEHAAEGICVGQGGVIRFANARCLALLGVAAQDVAARPMMEYVHPEDREFVTARRERRAMGENVPAFEARFRRADGTVSWVEINGVLIDWEGASANLFFLKDVTARKQAEEAVRVAGERYRAVVENVNEAIFVAQEGTVRFANASARRLFASPLVGEPSINLIHPDDRATVLAQRERMHAGSLVEPYEARFISPPAGRPGAHTRGGWASIYGVRIDWDARPALLILMSDVSERRELDSRLKSALAQREAILETTAVGVTFLQDRRHQWLNRTLAQMLGYEPAELLGQETRLHFATQADFDRVGVQAYSGIAETGRYSSEVRMLRKDGTQIWVQIDGTAIHRADALQGTVWTYVDVTQRKAAEEEVRNALAREQELGELKTRLVSMASHEFRTPLAAILSSAELISHYGDKIGPEEQRSIMADLVAGARRMQVMLEDMLTVGEAQAGKLRFRPQPADLRSLCATVLAEVRSAQGGQHLLTLEADAACSAPRLLDARLVHYIVGNLLTNACKYSPPKSVVSLSLHCDGDTVRLDVADQGIGVPEADLPRLFDSFHRAANAGNRPGSGLGLAIVKRSVELHGGSISVASELGAGSVFTVLLPCPPAGAAGSHPSP